MKKLGRARVQSRLIVGIQGVRAYMQQSRIFVGMVLILIFGEVLGLYGYVLVPYWSLHAKRYLRKSLTFVFAVAD